MRFVAPTHIALTTQILFLRSSMGNIALNCNRIQSQFSTEPPKNIKRIVGWVGDALDTPGQELIRAATVADDDRFPPLDRNDIPRGSPGHPTPPHFVIPAEAGIHIIIINRTRGDIPRGSPDRSPDRHSGLSLRHRTFSALFDNDLVSAFICPRRLPGELYQSRVIAVAGFIGRPVHQW